MRAGCEQIRASYPWWYGNQRKVYAQVKKREEYGGLTSVATVEKSAVVLSEIDKKISKFVPN